MYPYLTIGGAKIYMTGIGIIAGLIIFLIMLFYYTKKEGLDYLKFFYKLPLFVLLPYLLGKYIFYAFGKGLFLPGTWNERSAILSPYNFEFHYLGLLAGFLIFFILFFSKVQLGLERSKWIDSFFFSFIIAAIPIGFFLMLGDDFLGKETDTFIGISSLTPNSEMAKFGKVHPLGLYVSLISLIIFLATRFFKKIRNMQGVGLLGFGMFLLAFNIVLIFQQYTRYFPLGFGNLSLDIKNYITLFVCFLMFHSYFKKIKKTHRGK